MKATLILFSGLPGCGKTTLARQLAHSSGIPLFAKDRFQSLLRKYDLAERATADGYHLMLDMADEQLSLGMSVILDAVFPLEGYRSKAEQTAKRHTAKYRPVYCYCSNELEWRRRLGNRTHGYVPDWSPVHWDEVERLREMFVPWLPDTTLFIDTMTNVDMNLATVLTWIELD